MKTTQVIFRAGPLDEPLQERTSGKYGTPGAVAKRDVVRYYAGIDDELARLKLSGQEWSVLRDALKGDALDPDAIGYLWAKVSDAVKAQGLDARYGVNGQALVSKLQSASYATKAAIVDATERWWLAQDTEGAA